MRWEKGYVVYVVLRRAGVQGKVGEEIVSNVNGLSGTSLSEPCNY